MEPTQEQADIIQAPLDSKLLVTAGPGTGKTFTLIKRIAYLIAQHDIAAGQELLILSFSRAAVKEIRDRCASEGGDLGYVNAITFDSFATRLLSDLFPNGDWINAGYDGRVETATIALRDGLSNDLLADICHVFVDEIQDLVGVRAEFVKQVLLTTNKGFSLFGDAAQGIYNFQLEEPLARERGAAVLYEWLYDRLGPREKQLTENHRASSSEARISLWAGNALNSPNPDYDTIYRRLISDLSTRFRFGDCQNFGTALQLCVGSVAVIARNNGQVLMLSRKLQEQGVSHKVNRGAEERQLPPWIARTLAKFRHTLITSHQFSTACQDAGIADGDIDRFWRILKWTERRGERNLDLRMLNLYCRRGMVPDWIDYESESQITLSSIHRVKGREFDTVVVANPSDDNEQPEFVGEEARALYVALTRAKSNLYRLEVPTFRGLRFCDAGDRWSRSFAWQTSDYEVKFRDLDYSEPPAPIAGAQPNGADIQNYIRSNVKPGDQVLLQRVGANKRNPAAVFHILHCGNVVGRTSPDFANVLLQLIRRNWRNGHLPESLGPISVIGVETVFGDPQTCVAAGFESPAGTWLSVRIGGLAALHF